MTTIKEKFEIQENGINMLLVVTDAGVPKLLHLSALPFDEKELHYRDLGEGFNLFEIELAGFDRPQERHGNKYIGSTPGYRMQFVELIDERNEKGRILTLISKDEVTQVFVKSYIQFFDGLSIIRIWHQVENRGEEMQTLTFISTLNYSGVERGGAKSADDKMKLIYASNKWQGEMLFHTFRMKDLGLEKTQPDTYVRRSSQAFKLINSGNWSTKLYLPMGYLENEETGANYFWQIENNGSWGWELGDNNDHLYLELFGPTEIDSHWFLDMNTGDTFTTVPAAFGVGCKGFDEAMGTLTEYRRRIRRPNRDNEELPIIFNDYMNCLFGEPTTEKEIPLIKAAAEAGAEYFVIDAGWYSDGFWWDSVGEWQESRARFPGGMREVTDMIRSYGMIPGAWLELEVMGVNCKMAKELPDECFFLRHGKRIYDRSRNQLDFRHPLVIAHANEVVDRLVNEYGIGYIKMDYNIEPGFGTEVNACSAGQGLLEHERAYLKWLDGVFERYPELVIENCSSGGMRIDYAMLSRYSIQSTSDQENYRRYSMVTANAPAALTPEQAAVWSYPLKDSSRENTIYNMINAMPLRIHQSGHLAELAPEVSEMVKEGLAVYKEIRSHIKASVPFWPWGLATIYDQKLCLGLRDGRFNLLAIWCLDAENEVLTVPVAHLAGKKCKARILYPRQEVSASEVTWNYDEKTAQLQVKFKVSECARLFCIEELD